MSNLTMSVAEREAFLADLHVGVLCVTRAPDVPPIAVPVWYAYEPGGVVRILSGAMHAKTRRAREHGYASLCAQTEELPYRYVTVEGPVEVEDGADPELRRALAHKYLGPEIGDAYLDATAGEESVTLTLRPERWRTTDYGKEPNPAER
jgi:PPOX class probable F420-dependent enzyme